MIDLWKAQYEELSGKPRAGSLARLARGAVQEANRRRAGLDGSFNDPRLRQVRAALSGLTSTELSWLANAVGNAAHAKQRAEINDRVAAEAEVSRRRHRKGHPEISEGEPIFDPACPLCNPDGWTHW